mgnify:CR=1 FL=1
MAIFAAWEARDPDRIAALHSADTQFQIHTAGSEPVIGRDHVRDVDELVEVLGWSDPRWRRSGTLIAATGEFHVRRLAYNVRLRLPRDEPLPRF